MSSNGRKPTERATSGINRIVVGGYKSIRKEQSIEVRPLTILAGANSSGKSSIMQPLLLLKQTLEAPYDPGTLLLNGSHLRFTLASQLLSQGVREFSIGIEAYAKPMTIINYAKDPGKEFHVKSISTLDNDLLVTFDPKMTHSELVEQLRKLNHKYETSLLLDVLGRVEAQLSLQRLRVFLWFSVLPESINSEAVSALANALFPLLELTDVLLSVIHVPGLRGNPEREYPITAVGRQFVGTFHVYTASVIAQWQIGDDKDKLNQLDENLRLLGLTSTVFAERINDAQIRLQVGRLPTNGKNRDLVNITDVGFGVSQALPVLVALLTAEPGQLVYIEQPEIHLHPRAQSKMAEVLAAAARRGVKVVVETHSSILLLGIQTLVAKAELDPDDVILHWFTRNQKSGDTKVSTATLDEAGRFGNWPEDFADTTLEAQKEYLNSAILRTPVNK
jgi:AAA domain, putative AbiEii toxin, Type IV TA system/Protein of unknown function (DUF3696)